MMEGLCIWVPGVSCFAAINLLLAFQLSLLSAQQGFFSINSCATSNITDTNGIHWTTDDNLFPDTSTCQESTVLAQDIRAATVRTFNVNSRKVCYNLTTETGHDYLIRATFLRWGWDSSFSVLVVVTEFTLMNSSKNLVVVEGVFGAEGGYEDLCLRRQRGYPHISGVGIRDLDGSRDYYFDDDLGYSSSSEHVLKVVTRVSYGSTNGTIISLCRVQGGEFMLKSMSIEAFTLEYVEAATQKYNTLIGEGGFGSVYRSTLPDGQEVAVKVRSATSSQGTRQFENELNLLSAIRHEKNYGVIDK